jgi:hypothetical protein
VSETHTLYRFWDAGGDLLYVGITGIRDARWRAHGNQKPWWREVATVTVEHYDDRKSLAAAEIAAIRAEKPRYNVAHTAAALAPRPRRRRTATTPCKRGCVDGWQPGLGMSAGNMYPCECRKAKTRQARPKASARS